jgi:hypothetical protein
MICAYSRRGRGEKNRRGEIVWFFVSMGEVFRNAAKRERNIICCCHLYGAYACGECIRG